MTRYTAAIASMTAPIAAIETPAAWPLVRSVEGSWFDFPDTAVAGVSVPDSDGAGAIVDEGCWPGVLLGDGETAVGVVRGDVDAVCCPFVVETVFGVVVVDGVGSPLV